MNVRRKNEFIGKFSTIHSTKLFNSSSFIATDNNSLAPLSSPFIESKISKIWPQAECETEFRTICLISQNKQSSSALASIGNNNLDQSTMLMSNSDLYFPNCVRLPRCAGCCPSKRLACVPIQIFWHNISIVHLRYSSIEKKFLWKESKTILAESHQKCACKCIQREEDCASNQIYLSEECRCVCKEEDRIRCINQNQFSQNFETFWNETDCRCHCRRLFLSTKIINNDGKREDIIHSDPICSNGYEFNRISCR
ncbi:hypothetical protein SSS_07532 [Sarcoptes scabiei]|uniref:Platelet-derived growth factor (PDGF) family profile domain-containing protein n=1 Tax=Sarcoptes scabiei TaxID=52283 RepID=A0A834VIA8_SARSC|nr:hypothetical protein SSS_07532 [Sarcoptes scabiei]